MTLGIDAGVGIAFVGDRVGGAEDPAGPAGVTKRPDAGVDRCVEGERGRRQHAAEAKQRAVLGVDDRAVTSELAEAGLERQRNVENVAVPHGVLDPTRPAALAQPRGHTETDLAEFVIDAHALDGTLARGHRLERRVPHGSAEHDGVALGRLAPAVQVGGLERADPHHVRPESRRQILDGGRRRFGRAELDTFGRGGSVEPRELLP